METNHSRLVNRWWERFAITPDNDIFSSSVSSAKSVKDVIRWHNKYKKCDKVGDSNE